MHALTVCTHFLSLLEFSSKIWAWAYIFEFGLEQIGRFKVLVRAINKKTRRLVVFACRSSADK